MSPVPQRPVRGLIVGMLVLSTALAAQSQLGELVRAERRGLVAKGPPQFLPSPLAVEVAAFGHRTTAADLLYLWAIQWFAETGTTAKARKSWLARVYDTITSLDPHFRDAYWLGFVSLLQDNRDSEAAFALAEKALMHEPGFTLLAIEAALTARRLGQRERMVHYLEVCSRKGGDPLAQRLLVRLNSARTAQQELSHWIALSEEEDRGNRGLALAYIRDLTVLIETTRLRALVACFEAKYGQPPPTLDLLVTTGYTDHVWLDPDGAPYVLDRRTRLVKSVTPSHNRHASRAPDGVDLSSLPNCVPDPLLEAE